MKIFTLLLLVLVLPAVAQQYEVAKITFSTTANEQSFCPAFGDSGIFFCKWQKKKISSEDKTQKFYFTDLFYAEQNTKGKWVTKEHSLLKINTHLNEGPIAIDSKNHTVIITKNISINASSKLGLFFLHQNNLQEIPYQFNNPDFNIAHPALSSDGTELYFTSDMPGGFGGTDIYVSKLVNGSWSKPKNLGSRVNSFNNEMFPYCHGNKLFYSSNKNGGLGKQDLYYSPIEKGVIQAAIHLPEPINSIADDFGIVLNRDGMGGVFSSDREQVESIYRFALKWPAFEKPKDLASTKRCYEFTEPDYSDSKGYAYYWFFSNTQETLQGKVVEHCFDRPGKYSISLSLFDSLTNTPMPNVAKYDLEVKSLGMPVFSGPSVCFTKEKIVFDATQTINELPDAKEFFWEFGDGSKGIGKVVEHEFSEPGEYEVRLAVLTANEAESERVKNCVRKIITAINE